MQKVTDLAEVTVSDTGALIPADTLRAAGIRPGDRVAVVRTTRGALMVLPPARADGPSLHTVVGINPRPAGVAPEADQAFLREIRVGDESQ